MFAWSKRSSHTVVSSCEFVLMEKSTVFLCGRSFFFLSFCVLQESGQMEQMAQTSMPRAGHMMDPCWPLLMTLAKCTCSPSPALNQGSVMLTHSDKHVNSQWQTQSTSEPGSACLYARVEICSTSQTRWLSTLPELRSYGVCLSTALWLSFNEHWGNPMKAQQK